MSRWFPLWRLGCPRRSVAEPIAPLEPADSTPAVSPVSLPADPESEPDGVLEDPGSDPRAELVYLDDFSVYYGLIGLAPEEINLESSDDLRWYAVWEIARQDKFVVAGVHWGQDLTAYTGIRGLHRGPWRELRWRRFFSRAEAQAGFREEAEKFGLPLNYDERLIGWIFRA